MNIITSLFEGKLLIVVTDWYGSTTPAISFAKQMPRITRNFQRNLFYGQIFDIEVTPSVCRYGFALEIEKCHCVDRAMSISP